MTNDIARTIYDQMGGRTFAMLTGSKQFVSTANGLHFKVGRNAKGITHVRITLKGDDTYHVEFCKWNGRTLQMRTVHESEGVYWDMLKDVFETHTGLYVTLHPRRA